MNQLAFLFMGKPYPLPYTQEELDAETKVCVGCGERKYLNDFYIRRYNKDRVPMYRSMCKSCCLERNKAQ